VGGKERWILWGGLEKANKLQARGAPTVCISLRSPVLKIGGEQPGGSIGKITIQRCVHHILGEKIGLTDPKRSKKDRYFKNAKRVGIQNHVKNKEVKDVAVTSGSGRSTA